MSWAVFIGLWCVGSLVVLAVFAAALQRGRPKGWRQAELERDLAGMRALDAEARQGVRRG